MKKLFVSLLVISACGGPSDTVSVKEDTTTTAATTKSDKSNTIEVGSEIITALNNASDEVKNCIKDRWPNGVEHVLGGHIPNENETDLIYSCIDNPDGFKEKNSESEHNKPNSVVNYTTDEHWRLQWEDRCEGTGTVMFANSPMKIEDIHSLSPYGQIVGGHLTPIDHMYFEPKDRSLGRDVYEVRAIQDAYIFSISVREVGAESQERQDPDFRLDMVHTCTFGSYFDLVTSLSPTLDSIWDNGNFEGTSVKAGDLIGYVGAQTLDFGVYNYAEPLDFINPKAYQREPWKIYTHDPFPYFPLEIRDKLLNKMIRKVEPRIGRINYDVDGTLSGNWFEVGTDFYNGVDKSKYWDGHFSLSLNPIDPSFWQIGIGSLNTEANNFIIQGSPDPLDVTVEHGKQIYELFIGNTYIVNDPDKKWWDAPYDENDIYGVRLDRESQGRYIMLELLETRLLQLEVFTNIDKDSIITFTEKSRLYER
jgi:hypothetical protein